MMKIKEVCSQTGLTARTIRYYIEEQLLFPDYKENYLGRRFYEFSEGDVKTLNEIIVFRKFGFSIADIKAIREHPNDSIDIIARLKAEKAEKIDSEKNLLKILEHLEEREYTFSELAKALSEPVKAQNPPVEKRKLHIGKILLSVFRGIVYLTVAMIPIFCAFGFIISYEYPTISSDPDVGNISSIFLTLVPTFVTILLMFIRNKPKFKVVRIIAMILCILYLPFSLLISMDIPSCSETTDIRNYREFDAGCLANRDGHFQEFFPLWYIGPTETVKQADGSYKTVAVDVQYFYHYYVFLDYTYDIYAEWPLEEDKFHAEVERVTSLFDEWEQEAAKSEHSGLQFKRMKKGSYQCLFAYDWLEPFTVAENNYDYYIFAYDEENLRVRYINCRSLENGADQPYYLKLDW